MDLVEGTIYNGLSLVGIWQEGYFNRLLA